MGNKGGETRGGARIGSWKENVERQETEAETAKEREIVQESENDKGRARSPGVFYPGKLGPSGPRDTRTLRS